MRFVVEMPERLAGMVKDAAAAANKLPTEFIRDLLRAAFEGKAEPDE